MSSKSEEQKKSEKIKHEEEYVEFLKKRLHSENYKANTTKEEQELTKKKYDKAKLKLRILKGL